jgi:hypothetical protein
LTPERSCRFQKQILPLRLGGISQGKDGQPETEPSPIQYNLKSLAEDYRQMRTMIYGQCPDFPEILGVIEKLEEEINRCR